MKRLVVFVLSTLIASAAVTSCGGGDESLYSSGTAVDKLTIVGAGN